MEHEEPKVVIQYLTILELSLDNSISRDIIKTQYRKLVHVYHPDASVDVYHDGERFKLLQKAYEYLSEDIEYVNSLIRNNFSNGSFYSNSSIHRESPKQEQNAYQTRPAYNPKKKPNLYGNNWQKTRKFHFVSSMIGGLLVIFIFAFGFIDYVTITNVEGSYPNIYYTQYTYNLYSSTQDYYGVYHCAVAFNSIVIGLLIVGLLVSLKQIKNNEETWKPGFLRLILNFITFGLSIPLAVFHMIVAGGSMYASGAGGAIVLTIFTWIIIALFFIKTIVSLIPFIKIFFSR